MNNSIKNLGWFKRHYPQGKPKKAERILEICELGLRAMEPFDKWGSDVGKWKEEYDKLILEIEAEVEK